MTDEVTRRPDLLWQELGRQVDDAIGYATTACRADSIDKVRGVVVEAMQCISWAQGVAHANAAYLVGQDREKAEHLCVLLDEVLEQLNESFHAVSIDDAHGFAIDAVLSIVALLRSKDV